MPELTAEEEALINEGMQCLAPGFRMFREVEMKDAVQRALSALSKELTPDDIYEGKVAVSRLIRKVITDVRREGYGVPFIWWWIYFETLLLKGIVQDPWSEVKWWLWDEMRGKGQVLTMWGCQNCLAPETMVRMWDGTTKRADMVMVDDFLMGDDSKPRRVLSTCAGQAPMVKITPKVGQPFVCTENHIQTVVCKRGHRNHGGKGSFSSKATPGKLYDVPVSEILEWKDRRMESHGLKSVVVQYPTAEQEFDPYIYGLWLGDGTKSKPEITGCDREVLDEWTEHFQAIGYRTNETCDSRRPGTKRIYVWHPKSRKSNPFLNFIRTSVKGSKFVRREYLVASEKQRLELLAGLIDTDGHLCGGCYYTLTSSDPMLMDGYVDLANSLGFRTSRNARITNYIGKNGELLMTETLSICGDISRVPVRIPRKKKIAPQQGRGVRKHGVTGFTAERVGLGPYAGFEVDGNHRFLLADGTITHNSSKTAWMGRFSVCQMCAWLDKAVVYASGPFKEHTEDKAWASVKEWIEHLRKQKSMFTTTLGVQFSVGTKECEVYDANTNRRSIARFVSLENASSVQGKKAKFHETSGMEGITILLVDEFIENPALKLKQAESNISSNYNFFGLLACNPLPDKVQHQALRRFSDAVNISNLQRDVHYRWRTAFGWLIRFAWKNSPNAILGRTAWPYLISKERTERQRLKGNDVIDSQVDAWGWGSGTRGSPLDAASVKWAGTYHEPVWISDRQKIMIVDAAFGGEDPASFTILEVGDAQIRDKEGKAITKRVFGGVDQNIIVVDADFTADSDWIEEMKELFVYTGGGFPSGDRIEPVKPGTKVGGSWHLAGSIIRIAQEYAVPPQNITFDSSQRGDCTTAILDAIGRRNNRWFYEGSRRLKDEEGLTDGWFQWPYQYERKTDSEQGELSPKPWSDYCSQTISMIWFFACEMIKAGFVMNGDKIQRGIDELIARPIARGRQGQGEGRKDVLGKDALKKMGIKSPTYGETLAIGIYFGVRFLNLIRLPGPELATKVTRTVSVSDIIRAGRRPNLSGW